MIVSKAVHMAEMMSIPVLGLIENYSWYQCPTAVPVTPSSGRAAWRR